MRWLKIIGCLIHNLANLLLGGLFCLLVFLIVILYRDGEVPVPDGLIASLDDELAAQGFRVEFDEVHLDLRGIILAQGVRVYSTENSESFFDAQFALVSFSLFHLLMGEFVPTEVSVIEGDFYCPAVISPRGQREAIIRKLFVNASSHGHEWQVQTFIFELLNAKVQIAGNVFTPLPGLEEQDDGVQDAPPDFVGAYIDVCRNILDLQNSFQRLQDPILHINVEGERKGPLRLVAQVYNEGYIDQVNQIVLGAGSVRVAASLDVDGILRPDGMGRMWLNSLTWDDHVRVGYTEALVELDNGLEGVISGLPKSGELYCYNIQAWGLPFDGAFATLNFQDMKNNPDGFISGRVRLKSASDWLAVEGKFRPSDQSGRLALDSEWNPEFFMKTTAIPAEDMPKGLKVAGRPRWRAWVDLKPGFKPENSLFDVNFDALSYENLHLEAAHVVGSVTDDELNLTSVDLMAKDYRVRGNYWQRFSTGDYRFQAAGKVWPKDLNVFITDQWWQDLWADVTFGSQPPDAAIDMSGQYGAQGMKNKIYGKATLRDVQYRGIPVPYASARIWQNSKKLDLFDFDIETNAGRGSVELHWDYLPDRRRNFLSFRARTDLPLTQGATIAAPSILYLANMFPSEQPPKLDLAGLVYGESTATPNDLYLKSSVFFPGKFEFEDVYFGNGSFVATIAPETITVSEGRFSLGQGKAALHTVLTRQPGGGLYVKSAMISIVEAKLWGLYESIPFLRAAREKQLEIDRKEAEAKGRKPEQKPFKEQYAGDVRVYFQTHGQLPDLNSFAGTGTLVLENANLGQLHLLGGMSRFLYAIGLHLGTLNFSNAQSDFSLARSNLNFPNVQITGATGLIDANGNFNFDTQALDFMISLHPFGNVDTPIVEQIFTVFSPLSDSLEVELSGTLLKPEYQVSVRPFAVFTGQSKVENPNEGIPTESNGDSP